MATNEDENMNIRVKAFRQQKELVRLKALRTVRRSLQGYMPGEEELMRALVLDNWEVEISRCSAGYQMLLIGNLHGRSDWPDGGLFTTPDVIVMDPSFRFCRTRSELL